MCNPLGDETRAQSPAPGTKIRVTPPTNLVPKFLQRVKHQSERLASFSPSHSSPSRNGPKHPRPSRDSPTHMHALNNRARSRTVACQLDLILGRLRPSLLLGLGNLLRNPFSVPGARRRKRYAFSVGRISIPLECDLYMVTAVAILKPAQSF